MRKVFNSRVEKDKRRRLRNDMPEAEKRLWYRLRNKQLCGKKFRRQYSIDSYVVDFYCPEVRLAIEIDGDSHFSQKAVEYDKRRQEKIESRNIKVMRFTNIDIKKNLGEVLAQIKDFFVSSS
ncbi:MAG: endonuclease domain-containing protein [Patescibacteria group bacterium]